jgi:hypothetical protein
MNRRRYADVPVDARLARGWLAGTRGGERRAAGAYGVTDASGASASLVHHGDDPVGGDPVFVPREAGPAVSWLLTEAALASSSQ